MPQPLTPRAARIVGLGDARSPAARAAARTDRRAPAIALGAAMTLLGCPLACAQSIAGAPPANARGAARSTGGALHEVLVLGSREPGVTAADSAAPVQLISASALETAAGNPSLMSALARTVPSFTPQAFGNDMAGPKLEPELRGL